MKLTIAAIAISLAFTQAAFSQDKPADASKPFVGESEATAIIINGNADSESYGAKTKNTWAVSDADLLIAFGKYIRTKGDVSVNGVMQNTETAKAWEAGLRYEHIFLKDILSGFVQHKAEHDPYNGVFTQRDSEDIGVKYVIMTNDTFNWFVEVGYRYSTVLGAPGKPEKEGINYARLYTEANYKFSETGSTKLWVEHLPNMTHSSEALTNAEFSASVLMTSIFSLKTAYLWNHNEGALSPLKKDSSTWTTALVAKY